MAIQLNEPIVTFLRDLLEANLPTELAAINAGVTDGFTAPDPVAVLDFVPPIGLLTDFPTVGIGDAPSRFEDDEGFSATGVHELLVIAYCQNADQRALAWQLRRYAQAVTRVALEGRKLGTAAWGTTLTSVDPGPTLTDNPDDPKTFASWVGIRIVAKRDEE